jgi:trk system potassium uptake protein TrkH
MSEFLNKLTAVMFYSALPLFIPLAYGIAAGDGGAVPIGLTIAVMTLPALPNLILSTLGNLFRLLHSLGREMPFNYARLIGMGDIRKRVEVLTYGEVLALTSIAWIIVPLLSILPYTFFGVPLVDALFESFSGWTSTGLSALPNVASLPKSILLFRSITQWVGGLGIVVLILTTFRGKEAVGFLKAEGRNQSEIGIGKTVSMLLKVYLVLTLAGIALLLALGIGIFDAVSLSFSGISNGGFYPFDSFPFTDFQKIALAIIMLAGATNFLFYQSISKGRLGRAFFDEEFVLYAAMIALAVLLGVYIAGDTFLNSFLNVAAAISGGGFAIGNLASTGQFAIYLLILLMLSGAMVGSTTGAIKLWRIISILKAMANQVREHFLPSGSVQVVKMNGLPIGDRMIIENAVFVFGYIGLFLAASGAFIGAGYDFEHALFIVSSAMGNVGLSTLAVPAMGPLAKTLLIILMYLGRIEIFPCLAMVRYLLRR